MSCRFALLQLSGGLGHALTAHSQHVRKKFLRQVEVD